MLNDSVVMLLMLLRIQWDPKHQWGDVTHTHTHRHARACARAQGYGKINTHRQDGRIVQSHHRILCNNSKCCRSALLCLSSAHAAWLSLPLSKPVSPHQLSLSCLSHGFKISLSLPPLALCAMPIPPSRPLSPRLRHLLLLHWLSVFLSLVCLLSFLRSPTHCFSFLLPLTPFFPATPAFCFAAIPSPAHLLCLLSHPDSLKPPPTSRFCHTCKLHSPFPLSLFLCSLSPCRWVNWACWHHRERKRRHFSLLHAPCYINVLAFFFCCFFYVFLRTHPAHFSVQVTTVHEAFFPSVVLRGKLKSTKTKLCYQHLTPQSYLCWFVVFFVWECCFAFPKNGFSLRHRESSPKKLYTAWSICKSTR